MDTCVICFEDMDMISFQDERNQTSTCIKLECQHAYHTTCIIRCLSNMHQKCPSCNKDKSPAEQLTIEGLARKLIGEIKKDDDIKFLRYEFKESASEYSDSVSILKKEIREFASKRKKELLLDEKRKYMLTCLSKIQLTAKSISQAKGEQYIAALHTCTTRRPWRGTAFDRLFFGGQEAYRICRLKTPRLYMSLY